MAKRKNKLTATKKDKMKLTLPRSIAADGTDRMLKAFEELERSDQQKEKKRAKKETAKGGKRTF